MRFMNTFSFVALMALLVYAPGQNFWNKTWLFPWAALLFTAIVPFCNRLGSWPLGVATSYALASGICGFAVAKGPYSLGMVQNSAYAVISVLAVFAFATHLVKDYRSRFYFVLAFFIIIAGIYYRAAIGAPVVARGVFIGNPSMTGCLLACLLPLYFTKPENAFDLLLNYLALIATCFALYLLDATVPWLVLIATLSALLAQRCRRSLPYIVGAILLAAASYYLIGYQQLVRLEFFNDSERFKIWGIALGHWDAGTIWTKLFGFGFGTTQVMLPRWNGHTGNVWAWYHNDFLQAFIELGVVGFSLILWAVVDLLMKSWKQKGPSFSILCGLIVYGFFNYPLRMAFPALFCGYIVMKITRDAKPSV